MKTTSLLGALFLLLVPACSPSEEDDTSASEGAATVAPAQQPASWVGSYVTANGLKLTVRAIAHPQPDGPAYEGEIDLSAKQQNVFFSAWRNPDDSLNGATGAFSNLNFEHLKGGGIHIIGTIEQNGWGGWVDYDLKFAPVASKK